MERIPNIRSSVKKYIRDRLVDYSCEDFGSEDHDDFIEDVYANYNTFLKAKRLISNPYLPEISEEEWAHIVNYHNLSKDQKKW
jgi:Na+-transporting NADH:ubiquinone oxidoreductase subunit NqrC